MLFGLYADILHPDPSNYRVLHNNHLGVISAIGLCYALALSLTQTLFWNRVLAYGSSLVLACGVIYSCSRTSWLSMLVGIYISFAVLMKYPSGQKRSEKSTLFFILSGVLFFAVMAILSLCGDSVHNRIIELGQLFYFETWHHTFNDPQNFGFLGIFRLQQLYELGSISKSSALFGIGFTHEVIGFHGLYFTILGASGLVGTFFFFYFFRKLFHSLQKSILRTSDWRAHRLYLGTLSALTVWLLASFMETLFLQFAVWVPVAIGLLLTEKMKNESAG